ncbi:MAG: aminopeptidase P family protein [Candidatus Cloacimonas sp.]|nr:aminopeptidase P N-terminal domain-containing protein [Candidatus Cloacimonadota bacterium]
MKDKILETRREKLSSVLENGCMLVVFAAKDDSFSFVQNNNFYYLTGLNTPEAILLMSKTKGILNTNLFIERTIPERIVWDGAKMSKEEAQEISKIDGVFYLDEFERVLASQLSISHRLFLEMDAVKLYEPPTKNQFFAEQIIKKNPSITIDNLAKLINPLRMKKDEWEVEQLKRAIEVTGLGIDNAYQNARAGMFEYQVEALIYNEMLMNGVRNWGFKPIVAGGKNAVTLHYGENNQKLQANKLLLLDVGALYNNYSADISRTFPIAKSFTKRQKEVYEEVLQVQKTIINTVEPGITLKDLNQKTVELLTEALFRLKLIKDKSEVRNYYMHGVSHFLGMDTHDVFWGDTILEPGNVITVEPGLYIEKEEIGIRIEDDILVTENGGENLSIGIPKEVEELEEIRRKALEKK